jgi:dipeptidyl aminopeptidase/acylaminoacyl peptidase
MGFLTRIFQEKPLFVIPRGEPDPRAEEVTLPAADGLALRGCYLRTAAPQRRGVILFGLEFGSNRWACRQYCQALLAAGYDVFAFEPRNQGESDRDPNYEPLQWVTDRDVTDMRAAVAYLKSRPDADPRGAGIFGISKGGSTGVLVAATDPWVRCVVTDGMYGTHTTMVPYMQRWIQIYSGARRLQKALPVWFYGAVGMVGVRKVARNRGVTYPSVEKAASRLNRPLLMIHGEGDTYIKPAMARAIFDKANGIPKKLWLVPKAKHNQALHVAGEEYNRMVVGFFDRHLAEHEEPAVQVG